MTSAFRHRSVLFGEPTPAYRTVGLVERLAEAQAAAEAAAGSA